MRETPPLATVNIETELDIIAARYKAASGVGISVLNLIGGHAEGLIERLPQAVQSSLETRTTQALEYALTAAHGSRTLLPDQASWLNQMTSAAMGAVGGAGGLPTALVELPLTTAMLLRVIEGVATEYGFDTSEENVRFDCVTVFSSAGPLTKDDGADRGFLGARLALNGSTISAVLTRVAPKLATVLGQKLATQTIPILGAVAGATTNYIYASYYEEIAHVHFALRKLAIDGDIRPDDLTARLALRM